MRFPLLLAGLVAGTLALLPPPTLASGEEEAAKRRREDVADYAARLRHDLPTFQALGASAVALGVAANGEPWQEERMSHALDALVLALRDAGDEGDAFMPLVRDLLLEGAHFRARSERRVVRWEEQGREVDERRARLGAVLRGIERALASLEGLSETRRRESEEWIRDQLREIARSLDDIAAFAARAESLDRVAHDDWRSLLAELSRLEDRLEGMPPAAAGAARRALDEFATMNARLVEICAGLEVAYRDLGARVDAQLAATRRLRADLR